MRREDLERVRAWAAAKIAATEDSQSTCLHFIKLHEALNTILFEMDCSSRNQIKGFYQRFVEAARRL
jgi:hypothetical protein